MGKVYEAIDGRLREFLLAQPVFFVATAPNGPDGLVNLSPKGGCGSFTVLDRLRVAYLDYTGSGIETIAHLRQNGRIVVMFCSFSGPPKIVRLHGRGAPVLPDDPAFAGLLAAFACEPEPGLRSVITVDVHRVSDSCGFAVPLMDHVADRHLLSEFNARKSPAEIADYWATRNGRSLDGLPGLAAAPVGPPASVGGGG